MQMHTVKRGETLATIAKKLQVSRADLAEANYLKVTSGVTVGSKLIIPRMPSATLLARASAGELEQATETLAVDVLKETTPLATPVAQRRTYQVKSGDTLAGIAKKTGTTISQLMNWNKLRTTNLQVGAKLVVQNPSSAANKTARR
jgi:membrane-bound lytic murein transglycosylase D